MNRLLGREDTVHAQTTHYLTGDPAFAVDRRGVIVLWNSAAEKTLGYPATTALGQRCWKLLSGQDTYGNQYCCERCPLREMVLRHESVHGFQVTYKTASEGRKKFAISCLIVYDGPGNELLLHICHAHDETRKDSNNIQSTTKLAANNQRGALTPRELEVLALLADGKNAREMASMMCISVSTVRNHIQHMLHKLHVHNRLEAVILGHRLNLI